MVMVRSLVCYLRGRYETVRESTGTGTIHSAESDYENILS